MNSYSINKTRLKRKLDKEGKKQVYILVIGIILIVLLIFKFGITALTGVAKLFIKINELTSSTTSQQTEKNEYIYPPIIDPMLSATNSAYLKVTGRSTIKNGKIQLLVNNSSKAETKIDKNGDFIFEEIEIEEGENTIKARIKTEENKLSDFSVEQKIYYAKKAPELEIFFPQEDSLFVRGEDEINIKGKTNPDNQVTINGYWALMSGDGTFSYFLKLNDGDNIIKIETIDKAGNKTTKDIKVTYQP